MRNILKHICDYRTLRARRDLLRQVLPPDDLHRLEALELLFAFDPGELGHQALARDRRRYMRLDVRIRAKLGAGVKHLETTIINIGGGGLVVSPGPSMRRGELTVIRIADRETHRQYQLPVQAVWKSIVKGETVLGLTFVGMPSFSDLPPAGNA
jgi:PilZ domain-containing protein